MHCIHAALDEWAKNYSGSKFNFIYCDHVDLDITGPSLYRSFLSQSRHVFTWDSCSGYRYREGALVWVQSDKQDTSIKDGIEQSFCLASLIGEQYLPMVRRIKDSYVGPRPTKPWHKNQKSEPMLRYFFSGFIDEYTDFIDLACRDPSALRAALALNARTVLGICSDQQLTNRINDDVNKFLALRNATQGAPDVEH